MAIGRCIAWCARVSVVLFLVGGCSDKVEFDGKQTETANLMPEAAARDLIAAKVGRAWATQPYINNLGWCRAPDAVIPIGYTDITGFYYGSSEVQVSAELHNGCNSFIRFRAEFNRDEVVHFKQALIALGARL
jgi:hypothetical protein